MVIIHPTKQTTKWHWPQTSLLFTCAQSTIKTNYKQYCMKQLFRWFDPKYTLNPQMSSSIFDKILDFLTFMRIPATVWDFIILSRVKFTSLSALSSSNFHEKPNISRWNYTQITIWYRVFWRKVWPVKLCYFSDKSPLCKVELFYSNSRSTFQIALNDLIKILVIPVKSPVCKHITNLSNLPDSLIRKILSANLYKVAEIWRFKEHWK